jgi:nanoRNase/pAp phosphatase (c-di-AMP/oligoRNAs hydrolase)
LGLIDDWKFVHPKDIQDGLVQVTDNDILANVPYVPGCKLWFDHHYSETERLGAKTFFEGISRKAPSAARVLYDYYGGDEKLTRFAEMIHFVDKVDSGNLSKHEILHPQGWVLLGFVMDPRTGLGRFHDFSISNYDLMKELARVCSEKDIDDILAMPDVNERVEKYMEDAEPFRDMIEKHTKIDGNVIFIDLRGVDPIYAGNRFIIYTLFPEQNITVWVIDGREKANVAVTVGYSIINHTATINIGSLMLQYGGGGHKQVGTCQVPTADADRVIAEVMEKLKQQPDQPVAS